MFNLFSFFNSININQFPSLIQIASHVVIHLLKDNLEKKEERNISYWQHYVVNFRDLPESDELILDLLNNLTKLSTSKRLKLISLCDAKVQNSIETRQRLEKLQKLINVPIILLSIIYIVSRMNSKMSIAMIFGLMCLKIKLHFYLNHKKSARLAYLALRDYLS